jgi:hypothetical protein
MTGDKLLFSSLGGVSSSESEQSSSKDVTEASDDRRPPLEAPLEARLTLEFDLLEALRSLSDMRKVEGPNTLDEGNAVLLTESRLVDSGLGLRARAYEFAAFKISDGELAI